MTNRSSSKPRSVVIASANPLFREGLRKLYGAHWGGRAEVVATPSSLDEVVAALDLHAPDLVILDYDDAQINRAGFLNRFVSGDSTMKVVLVSLGEAGQVVVYDRRQLTHSQANDWLLNPWREEELSITGGSRSMDKKKNLGHYIVVALLVLVVTLLVDYALASIELLPVAASAQSATVDRLFRIEAVVISFLFALITVPLFYSLFVFRRRPGDEGDGEHMEGNTKLEVAWTVIPLFAVLAFAYLGADSLAETRRVDPTALEIKVTGYQWSWKFEYPQHGGFASTELVLPVDQQAVLRMESPDVVHSFWVPEFRIKQDLVPGRITEYRITPTLVGDYKVRCAELCGTKHAYMESPVRVVTRAEFDAWVAEQQAAAASAAKDPIEMGKRLVSENGCAACHSLNGTAGVGPTWQGLFGSQVELADGSLVTADDAYIFESIKNPNARIHKGYQPNAMPQFKFSDEQIGFIVEYIKTIR